MARPQEVDDAEVKRLRVLKYSAPQIASALGVSRTTVYSSLRRQGLLRENVRHDDNIPWTLDPRHTHSMPARYLRALSLFIKTGGGDQGVLKAALTWANTLAYTEQDLEYDPEYKGLELCPEGGWRLIPESESSDPSGSYIKSLISRVESRPD